MKAITRGIARFDEDTKAAFADLYTKVDAKVIVQDTVDTEISIEE